MRYLGEGKETGGERDDILHLGDAINSLLDCLGVLIAGLVEDVLDTLDIGLCPLHVGPGERLGESERG